MALGTLHVVATPIGNLDDVTKRAVETLQRCAVVYAEDTRRSRILFERFGITTALRSLHEHNERARAEEVIEHLARGEDVALVSDAGTPAVSDPGAVLVEAVARAGHRVSPIPGASALASAVSVAGFAQPRASVLFLGFLPVKGKERAAALAEALRHHGVVVLFEAPHRIADTLAELAVAQPERPACLCRELTKIHEELVRGSVAELARWAQGEMRGEMTLVLGPLPVAAEAAPEVDVDGPIRRCLAAGLSARDTAAAVAAVLERPKRDVYQRVQELSR